MTTIDNNGPHARPRSGPRNQPADTDDRQRRHAGLLRAWFSAPVVALVGGLVLFGVLGIAGLSPWQQWPVPLRWSLAVMFLLTASARFGPRAESLRAMVPPGLPRPALLVAVSGVLEALGAVGLLVPATAPAAGWCLAALLIALFPANVHAARAAIGAGDRAATPLPIRTVQQVIFVACAVLAAL